MDAVEGRSSVSAEVVRTDEKKISIQFTAAKDPSQTTLNQLKPALGETSVPAVGEKEIIVDASAKTLGYKPGDKITVKLRRWQISRADSLWIYAQCDRFPVRFYKFDECLCYTENTGMAGWVSKL